MSTQEAIVNVATLAALTIMSCFTVRAIRDIHRDAQNTLAGK